MLNPRLVLIAEHVEPTALFELTGQSTVSSGEWYSRQDGLEVQVVSYGIERKIWPPELPSYEILISWTADAVVKVALAQCLRVLLRRARRVRLKDQRRVLTSEEDALKVLQSVLMDEPPAKQAAPPAPEEEPRVDGLTE
jgi:hypothetical protein